MDIFLTDTDMDTDLDSEVLKFWISVTLKYI
jgi:hypothetical protein